MAKKFRELRVIDFCNKIRACDSLDEAHENLLFLVQICIIRGAIHAYCTIHQLRLDIDIPWSQSRGRGMTDLSQIIIIDLYVDLDYVF